MNKKTKLFFLIIPLFSLIFMGQLCSSGGGNDGGIFMSYDNAENWEQKNLLGYSEASFLRSSRAITNNSENILTIQADPINPNTIYYGTVDNGLFKTSDSGELWEKMGTITGAVLSISINPKDNNTIFIGNDYSVSRSLDGGENWEIVHSDPQSKWLRAVVVDWYKPKIIYAASENGSVIQSKDNGDNWNIIYQIEAQIKQLLIDPFDSRILYAVDHQGNIHKTINSGKDWVKITDKELYENPEAWPIDLEDYHGLFNLATDPNTKNRIYASTEGSLVRSNDGGKTWQPLDSLIPAGDEKHNTVQNIAVDSSNPKIIYFTVLNVIHKTNDSGKNWHTIENFPSVRRISYLLSEPSEGNILIAGTREIEEKKGLIGK